MIACDCPLGTLHRPDCPNRRPGDPHPDDEAAVAELVKAVTEEVNAWHTKGEYNARRIRDAQGLMLEHLRRARQEGPLV